MLFSKLTTAALCAVSAYAVPVNKRSQTCSFPTDSNDLVEITPNSANSGFAMSPNQQCSSGSWCPYACKPGQLMAQWDSKATSYSYPESQNGGLYCDDDGNLQKPFENRGYCMNGTGAVSAKSSASGGSVAFCQTVLPGNEAMLIPTEVNSSDTTLAVPGSDYYAGTAAHYYINAPGISTDDACTWGSSSKAQGNWAPYVAGANTNSDGSTYVKIGWNPKYIDDFSNQQPEFGIKITCDNEGDCNGLDCQIDPSKGFNQVQSSDGDKQENAAFCVVTATNGAKASIEIFNA